MYFEIFQGNGKAVDPLITEEATKIYNNTSESLNAVKLCFLQYHLCHRVMHRIGTVIRAEQ